MLILRNGVPRYALDDIWTFGSPYVFDRGAEDLMQRIGLQRDFIKGVIMGKDIVTSIFFVLLSSVDAFYSVLGSRAVQGA